MNNWTVYEHVSPSGKIYIGITSRPIKRRWAHGTAYKSCILFDRAIKKYGWDNIQHNIIATGLGEGTAKNMEKDLIAFNKVKGISYNITDGGDGVLGRPCSELRREMTRNIWKGKKIPKDIVEKSASKRRGIHLPKEQVEKIRIGKIGNGNGNKAVCFIKDNIVMFEFPSCVKAAEYFKVHPSNISRCARKEYQTFKGYIITYKKDMKIFHPDVLHIDVIEKDPYVGNQSSRYVEVIR